MSKPAEKNCALQASKKVDAKVKEEKMPDLGKFEFPDDYDVFEDDVLIMMP